MSVLVNLVVFSVLILSCSLMLSTKNRLIRTILIALLMIFIISGTSVAYVSLQNSGSNAESLVFVVYNYAVWVMLALFGLWTAYEVAHSLSDNSNKILQTRVF